MHIVQATKFPEVKYAQNSICGLSLENAQWLSIHKNSSAI